jgi:hypothetical protein
MWLVHLGNVLSVGEFNIDHLKIGDIFKWTINVIDFRSFVEATQYLRKFTASFSLVETPFHAIIKNDKSFKWSKSQQKYLEKLNHKISWVIVLELPKMKRSLEI